jgi:hypothetical protein
MTNYAVLTGDIVKSSDLPDGELDRIFANLSHAAELIASWQGSSAHLTRNRGDGWQMAVAPAFALRAVFAARAAVRMTNKRYDTRIALAIGTGTIPGPTLADASGAVFVASGQALEHMPRRRDMVVASDQGTHGVVLRLAEEIIKRWTEAQAEVALQALAPQKPTQAAIAATLNVVQQTVQAHFDASGVDALIETCEALDAL